MPGSPDEEPGRQGARGCEAGREARWPDFKARATAAYQAPSRAIARDLAEGLVRDYESKLPSAVACFMDDFEACIAHLRLPVTHRRATRTTNLLERLFLEERRRLKIIPNAFWEKAVLKLMFAAMTRAAERWRAIRITDFERRQIAALRQELDQQYEAHTGLAKPTLRAHPIAKFPADPRLDRSGKRRKDDRFVRGRQRVAFGLSRTFLKSSGVGGGEVENGGEPDFRYRTSARAALSPVNRSKGFPCVLSAAHRDWLPSKLS